ncbi:MAG: leucyl/phenylalanyl-tRNA--protein transferase [Pseudomonadota bacterium]
MPRDSSQSIDPTELLQAYALGYFPMAQARDAQHVMWVLPEERGVLQLDAARAPRRLLKTLKRAPFDVRVDTVFADVMQACAEAAPDRRETWINDQILEVYTELHFRGAAHSVECFKDGALVGGLYGVALGGVFCGESMFSRATDASKIAMLHLIARLKQGGFQLLDTQFYTKHLAQFGVAEIPDAEYQKLLARALNAPANFYSSSVDSSIAAVAQSITQIS